MAESQERIAEIAARMTTQTPQAAALGVELISASPVIFKVPWREDLVGDPDTGVIAGGAVTTVLDHACGLAIHVASPDTWGGPTLDLRIDYMRPAAPRAAIFAEAHCYKVGRTIAFVRASAYDVEIGDPIATAQGAFALNPRPAK